jgi:hypothetical protein
VNLLLGVEVCEVVVTGEAPEGEVWLLGLLVAGVLVGLAAWLEPGLEPADDPAAPADEPAAPADEPAAPAGALCGDPLVVADLVCVELAGGACAAVLPS